MNEYYDESEFIRLRDRRSSTQSDKVRRRRGLKARRHDSRRVERTARALRLCVEAVPKDVERFFPWCHRVTNRDDRVIDSGILQDTRYQRWFRDSTHTIQVMEEIGRRVGMMEDKELHTGIYDLLVYGKQNPKVPRYVRSERVQVNDLFEQLMDSNRFWDADTLLRFQNTHHHESISSLRFRNSSVIDVVSTMNKVASNAPECCSSYDPMVEYTPNWVVIKGFNTMECFLVMVSTDLERTRLWLVGDLLTDTSSIRKDTTRLAPLFVRAYFLGGEFEVFVVIRTLLRFITVSRVVGRGLMRPSHPAFSIYRYLPHILEMFDVQSECHGSYQNGSVDHDDKNPRGRSSTQTFLSAIAAFAQMLQPHSVDSSILCEIEDEIQSNPVTKAAFPILLEIIDTLIPRTYDQRTIDLTHASVRLENGSLIEAHVFLYAFCTCPLVPKDLRKRTFLNLRTDGTIQIPRAGKSARKDAPKGWTPNTIVHPLQHKTHFQLFGELFTTLEQMSHFPAYDTQFPHESRGQCVLEPCDAYDYNFLHQPNPRYLVQTTGPILFSEAWVQRWAEYTVPFLGPNPYFLEVLVYFLRFGKRHEDPGDSDV